MTHDELTRKKKTTQTIRHVLLLFSFYSRMFRSIIALLKHIYTNKPFNHQQPNNTIIWFIFDILTSRWGTIWLIGGKNWKVWTKNFKNPTATKRTVSDLVNQNFKQLPCQTQATVIDLVLIMTWFLAMLAWKQNHYIGPASASSCIRYFVIVSSAWYMIIK
jgi:hypothetical protein